MPAQPSGDFEPQEAPTKPSILKPPIGELIARSSLGTPGAVAVRALAPATLLAEVISRLDLPVEKLKPFDPARLNEPYDTAELDAVAADLERRGALDEFEQQALEAWNDDSIELSASDEQHLDAARARVLAFAKDQALLDWLDEPEPLSEYQRLETAMLEFDARGQEDLADEVRDQLDSLWWMLSDGQRAFLNSRKLAADSQGHGATPHGPSADGFAVPAGGGATDTARLRSALQSSSVPAPPGEIGGDANAKDRDSRAGLHEPASLVRVTGGASAELAISQITPADVFAHCVGGLSANSKVSYRKDLQAFARWIGLDDDKERVGGSVADYVVKQLNRFKAKQVAVAWNEHMLSQKKAPNTRARRLASLRAVIRAAEALGLIDWELNLRGPKVKNYRDTSGPSVEVIRKMFGACGEGVKGIRDRAILWLMLTLALRRHELCNLKTTNYDRANKRVQVFGKGGTEVWSLLQPRTHAALEAWMIAGEVTNESASLFCTLEPGGQREPLTVDGLYKVIVDLGVRAQDQLPIEQRVRVRPHGLRHAAITLGLVNNDIRAVRLFSRHASVQTVITYDDNRQDLAGKVAAAVEAKIAEGME